MPPKFRVVMNDVIASIRSGRYRPGDKLPSGAQMCEQYGVSQMTIRTAVERLRALGWVETVPGSGVFVADTPPM